METSRPPSATSLRTLKLIVLAVTGSLVLAFGVLALMGLRLNRADTIWVPLPLILGAANALGLASAGAAPVRLSARWHNRRIRERLEPGGVSSSPRTSGPPRSQKWT
jgi:predicted RND superfamily exporter protein